MTRSHAGRVHVGVPVTAAELDHVRTLMCAFVAWHRQRHREDLDRIDRYFDADEFAAELAGLPGAYAPPAGQLLLATVDAQPAGCVLVYDTDAE